MFHARFVVLAATLTLAAACGSDSSSPPAAPSPTPDPAPTGPSAAVTIPVNASTLGNRAFVPATLNVAPGTSVTWTNTDAVAHTSTSDGPGWDAGVIAPGGRFSFTFPTAGTFPYHCAIHPGMVGTVVVR
jgi:plastocyanin